MRCRPYGLQTLKLHVTRKPLIRASQGTLIDPILSQHVLLIKRTIPCSLGLWAFCLVVILEAILHTPLTALRGDSHISGPESQSINGKLLCRLRPNFPRSDLGATWIVTGR